MSKHHGLYDNSPTIKGDEEGGRKVVKTPKKDDGDGPVDKGVEGEGFPVHARHAHDRHMLHAKHEHEHAMHDHHKEGHKKELHARHEKEIHDMHMRHEKEMGEHGGQSAGKGGSTGEPIEKVEKNAKG